MTTLDELIAQISSNPKFVKIVDQAQDYFDSYKYYTIYWNEPSGTSTIVKSESICIYINNRGKPTESAYFKDSLPLMLADPLRYNNISLSLNGSRTDSAQGLTAKVNSLTVLTLNGGALSIKLNSTSNDLITLQDNMKIDGLSITEIYWTNAAQTGKTARIFIAYIP